MSTTIAKQHVAALLAIAGFLSFNFPGPDAYAQGNLNPPGAPSPTMKTLDQVEPRAPVDASNTPGDASTEFIISSPGSYYLTANVDATKTTGIAINAEGVTLDLNGFEVRRTAGSGGDAIRINASRCNLSNGILRGFQDGIDGPGATRLRLTGMTITGMTSNGIVTSAQAHIENCLVENAGGIGISAGIVSLIRNCTIRTTGSHGIKAAESSIIEDNVANNCQGDSIIADNRCTIRNNTCDFPPASGAGIHLTSNQGESRVEDNNITRRAVGIQIDGPDNFVSGNTVRQNVDNYDFASGNFLNLLLCEIPESIDWPAAVKLAGTQRYAGGTNGIVINTDDVTIDLGGHALIGGPGSAHAVYVPGDQSGITVRNGTIRNWGSDGIRAFNIGAGRFEGLHAISNGWSSGFGMGIRVGYRCVVKDCSVIGNQNNGIAVEFGSTVIDCAAGINGLNGIDGNIGTTVSGCSVWNNGADGIDLFVGSSVQNCSVNNNGQDGIDVDEGSTVSDCAARNNAGAGIRMSTECTAQNCAASGNGDGIWAAAESTIRNCTTARNNNDGIEVESDCLIVGNHSVNNGRSSLDGAGIRATGSENRIDGNHVAQNDIGILINDSAVDRNWVVRNTARDNSGLNYVIPSGNRVGIISVAPISGAISGDTSPNALGAGTTDPWANFSY